MSQAIILAAKSSANPFFQSSSLPDTMLTINGKPVLAHILQDLSERGIKRVSIVLDNKDILTSQYIKKLLNSDLDINVSTVDSTNSIVYSIASGLESLSNSGESVLVYLGDTISKDMFALDENFFLVSDKYEESGNWCFVEQKDNECIFINKPDSYSGSGLVMCGLYNFTNKKSLKKAVATALAEESKNISDIIQNYISSGQNFSLVKEKYWYDFGNPHNYYKAKIDFLNVRSFNNLQYNSKFGTITKKSSNNKKICDEINWYKNLPSDLEVLAPRLLDSSLLENNASYTIEYYGYPALSELFLFHSFDARLWGIILEELFAVIDAFMTKSTKDLSTQIVSTMYLPKTKQRLEELAKDVAWQKRLLSDELLVNNKSLVGVYKILSLLESDINNLANQNDISFIHGDFCFSNILFDRNSKLVKLIDPRGSFGHAGCFGDIKYDIAKLWHSVHGKYDFIVNDFSVADDHGINGYTFEVLTFSDYEEIERKFSSMVVERGFKMFDIKLIEGLLFLSMLPLHSDQPKRQLSMFLMGITILNNVLEEKNKPNVTIQL